MSPEAQRIAIAEACGWTCAGRHWLPNGNNPLISRDDRGLPNYLSDLNAVHEAEKALDGAQFKIYTQHLMDVVSPGYYPVIASAAQRAEALLRTLGKWDDAK